MRYQMGKRKRLGYFLHGIFYFLSNGHYNSFDVQMTKICFSTNIGLIPSLDSIHFVRTNFARQHGFLLSCLFIIEHLLCCRQSFVFSNLIIYVYRMCTHSYIQRRAKVFVPFESDFDPQNKERRTENVLSSGFKKNQ